MINKYVLVFFVVLGLLIIADQLGLLGELDSFLRKMIRSNKVDSKKILDGMEVAEKPTPVQRQAIQLLTEEFEKQGDGNLKKLAYIFATAKAESNFKPVSEGRCREGESCYEAQKAYWNTGYYGRGYVQITWENNYRKFSKIIGKDLVSNPALVLQPEIAAKIAVYGMIHGSFRAGNTLAKYFNSYRTDWKNARNIINGDVSKRGAEIGAIAQKYYNAIS